MSDIPADPGLLIEIEYTFYPKSFTFIRDLVIEIAFFLNCWSYLGKTKTILGKVYIKTVIFGGNSYKEIVPVYAGKH